MGKGRLLSLSFLIMQGKQFSFATIKKPELLSMNSLWQFAKAHEKFDRGNFEFKQVLIFRNQINR